MREIMVPAKVECLDEVLEFVEAAMTEVGADIKYVTNISIAVEEIFVNIAHYAYPDGEGDISISLLISQDKLVMEFKDRGIPYDPLSREDPDTSLSAEEREIGGLGIFMVKNMMDDVNYRYEDGYNVMTIMKLFGE